MKYIKFVLRMILFSWNIGLLLFIYWLSLWVLNDRYSAKQFEDPLKDFFTIK